MHQDSLKVCNDKVWNNICNNIDSDLIDSPINNNSSSLNESFEQNEYSSDIDN